MKVLHVREVANVAHLIVRGLCELGVEAEFASPRESAERRAWLKLLMAPRRVLDAVRINAYIHQKHFEVVHFHYANSGWMGTLGGYPYILHCHGSDVRLDQYHPLRKWPVLHSLRHAHGVFFSTPDLYPHVKSVRPDGVFLPNPVDAHTFVPSPEGSSAPRRARVLIHQTLKASKAPQVAFEAARQLKRKFGDLEICAFASGPELERFRAYTEVHFIDAVPHAQMPELVGSFDIIIGQFGIGSLGVTELESMACAKPVVCYVDFSVYQHWYDDAPPVLCAREPDAVAEAVASLLQDSAARDEIGTRARQWILKHHHYRPVAAQVLSHYQRLMPGL